VHTAFGPSNNSNELGQPPTVATTYLAQPEIVRGAGSSELNQPTPAVPTRLALSEVDRGTETSERPLLVSPAPSPSDCEPVLPLSEGRYKIQFTAGQRVRDLLQEAQDLFRNQLPNGDMDVLFERALGLLVSERKKQLYAQTDKPRRSANATPPTASPTSKPNSRHIPSAIKRRVYLRDKGQCRFLSPTGERCCARSRLEFHHIEAFGFGGPPTEKNIVLFCRAHNALMAERDFSREHIQRCIQASRAAKTHRSAVTSSAQATAQRTHARHTHTTAPERAPLSMAQYQSTRSGISERRERSGGLNQPLARRPESDHGLDE
jgi:5-methylcytosine-specific restriction endonuclease McrA